MSFIVVIPARYASTRFPGKPLAMIKGLPMIQHVHERCKQAGASEVIVATDDTRIGEVARGFGAKVCYTSTEHQSGTERIAEVLSIHKIQKETIVVNVQGDEPFIPVENITQVARNLQQCQDPINTKMATLCFPIGHRQEIDNPNIVKVVFAKTGKALYFSRGPIPYDREWMNDKSRMKDKLYYRHVGIYAYTAQFVHDYLALSSATYEACESLEQLRVLEHGFDIHVEVARAAPPHGVDTPEDLAKLV